MGFFQKYGLLLRARPEYRKLWLAQVISLTGDWFNTIASVVIVTRYTDSGLAISGLFLARFLPVFFFGPLAGVIADRFNRKMVLVLSNVSRAPVVLAFLLITSQDTVWLVYALSILQFSLSAFFEPAYAAVLPGLVTKDELLTANTLSSVTWSVMLTVGGVIGGAVTGVFGVAIALSIDALTFLLAAGIILTIRYDKGQTKTPEEYTSQWRDFIDGLGYVREHRWVGAITLVKALIQVGSIDVLIAVYAEEIFVVGEDGATTLGILFAGHGLGAILGPLLGDWISDGSEEALAQWIGFGFTFAVVGWFIFGVGPTLAVVTVGIIFRGMGGSINWTYSSVLLQMKVPDKFLGRVFGLDFTIFMLGLSLSVWLCGLALDTWNLDPRELVMYVTALSLIPMGIWLVLLRLRPVLESPPEASAAD